MQDNPAIQCVEDALFDDWRQREGSGAPEEQSEAARHHCHLLARRALIALNEAGFVLLSRDGAVVEPPPASPDAHWAAGAVANVEASKR